MVEPKGANVDITIAGAAVDIVVNAGEFVATVVATGELVESNAAVMDVDERPVTTGEGVAGTGMGGTRMGGGVTGGEAKLSSTS